MTLTKINMSRYMIKLDFLLYPTVEKMVPERLPKGPRPLPIRGSSGPPRAYVHCKPCTPYCYATDLH